MNAGPGKASAAAGVVVLAAPAPGALAAPAPALQAQAQPQRAASHRAGLRALCLLLAPTKALLEPPPNALGLLPVKSPGGNAVASLGWGGGCVQFILHLLISVYDLNNNNNKKYCFCDILSRSC